jgi:hypothetical protein
MIVFALVICIPRQEPSVWNLLFLEVKKSVIVLGVKSKCAEKLFKTKTQIVIRAYTI